MERKNKRKEIRWKKNYKAYLSLKENGSQWVFCIKFYWKCIAKYGLNTLYFILFNNHESLFTGEQDKNICKIFINIILNKTKYSNYI